jgi:hypothetical protein
MAKASLQGCKAARRRDLARRGVGKAKIWGCGDGGDAKMWGEELIG